MAENEVNGAAKKKASPEVTKVKMKDGSEEAFVGKRNLNKDFAITDAGVTASFAFRNGDKHSITISKDDPLLLQLAGHGLVQKGGDEAAGIKVAGTGEPDIDSMSMAVEDILKRLANTEASVKERWFTERAAGDGFSGASVVVQAIAEVTGLTVDQVKAKLADRLEKGKGDTPPLSRQALNNSFKKPGTKTAAVIERIEKERAAGQPSVVDADAELAAMVG